MAVSESPGGGASVLQGSPPAEGSGAQQEGHAGATQRLFIPLICFRLLFSDTDKWFEARLNASERLRSNKSSLIRMEALMDVVAAKGR